jgi:hypothetical protein
MKIHPGSYLEAHSALNRPFVAYALFAPALLEIACLTLGLAFDQPWFFVFMGWLLVPIMICSGLLYRSWPTGVRVDESGISIGAVRSAQAAARRPTVNHQSWGLYTCLWPAVLGVRVVTDQDELAQMKNSPRFLTLTNSWSRKAGMDHCNIGVLASPFMRAALVIEVNPAEVTASKIRPARFYTNFKDGYFSHLVQPQLSPTWVVPTRHPGVLSAALQTVPGGQDLANGHWETSQRGWPDGA